MIDTRILYGTQIANKIINEQKIIVDSLKDRPCLGIILVGKRPDSQLYIKMKKKQCDNVGINYFLIELEGDSSQSDILDSLSILNENPKITAILVQLPLPIHINEREVLNNIKIEKDVEGFHNKNMGNLVLNNNYVAVCTPLACIELLNQYNIELEGKHVVIIGKSNCVGLPLSLLALHKNATVTICHIFTKNLKLHTQNADILMVACGCPKLITKDYIKDGCVIIDIGIHKIKINEKTKIIGDVDFDDVINKVSAITPVPGGIGPMTIAMLIKNIVLLSKRFQNI